MRGKIYKDTDGEQYVLFSPQNQNGRMYRYYADKVLKNVMYVGIYRFKEIEYNGKIYTERSLKIKQINDNRSRQYTQNIK